MCQPKGVICSIIAIFYSYTMIYKKIYTDYYEKLVNLPMDDTTFIAKLLAQNLLPGDMENKIEVQAAPINKASYFLNHMIKPSIDLDNGDCFDKLLSVMEHCGYDHIKHLALEIKSVIKGNPHTNGHFTSHDKFYPACLLCNTV